MMRQTKLGTPSSFPAESIGNHMPTILTRSAFAPQLHLVSSYKWRRSAEVVVFSNPARNKIAVISNIISCILSSPHGEKSNSIIELMNLSRINYFEITIFLENKTFYAGVKALGKQNNTVRNFWTNFIWVGFLQDKIILIGALIFRSQILKDTIIF